MSMRISRQHWQGLLGELEAARQQRHLVTYRALIERLQLPTPAMQTLVAALEHLAALDARAEQPLRSALVISQGASQLIKSAAGTRMALFTSEPLATAHTTGSSRSACTPVTCWAFRARSSPSTPAVFLAATLVMVATSSRMLAMSSISAMSVVPAMLPQSAKGGRMTPEPRKSCPSAPRAQEAKTPAVAGVGVFPWAACRGKQPGVTPIRSSQAACR